MKKLIALMLTLGSFAFIGSVAETNATTRAAVGKPQVRIQIGRGRRWRNRDRDFDNRGERLGYGYGRVITQTRLVQRGWHTYRETYQVRYFPDGRTETTLISRMRVD